MPFFLRHQVSLILGVFISLALIWIVVIPPFQMPDEPAHYIVSCGKSFADKEKGQYGHRVDTSFEEIGRRSPPASWEKFDIGRFFSSPIKDTGNELFFANGLPNMVAYAGSSITCHAMTHLGISKQYVFYAMRIANLCLFTALLLLAIRTHRELFIALSPMLMIPMVINQSVAIGADSFSIATCILAATVIAAGVRNTNISAGLTALTLFLLLNTKMIYLIFALPLAWVVIKNGVFSKTGSLTLHIFSGILALGIQLATLSRMTTNESTSTYSAIKTEQLINDPMHFFSLLESTVGRKFWIYVQTTIGKVGWLDTPVSWFGFYSFITSAVIVIFILSAPVSWNRLTSMLLTMSATGASVFASIHFRLKGILLSAIGYTIFIIFTGNQRSHTILRLLILASIIGSCFLAFLSMHLFWGPAGMRYIEGVQGRYFLPMIPFLIALLYLQQPTFPNWKKYATGGIFLFNLTVTLDFLVRTVIPRFYG